jgi:hypothetical protein
MAFTVSSTFKQAMLANLKDGDTFTIFHEWDVEAPKTCMWCAAPYPTIEELEAHEEDCR